MCEKESGLPAAYSEYQQALVRAGHLIRTGVPGVYGLGGRFEAVIERFERYVTRMGSHLDAEVVRFPPLLARSSYASTDHLENFPDLVGSVHGFRGTEEDREALVSTKASGADWSTALCATDVVLTPAACYPLYPTVAGDLPQGGRTIDLRAFVFRHEPSEDPARMQIFRQREYVRLGSPEQALEHRDDWIDRAGTMLRDLGLEVTRVLASDPFFGRGGRLMKATQREQALKFELLVPIASAERPTAVVSSNCHLDAFGNAFGIRQANGQVAHTACVGFGLERIALALLRRHGLEPERWPAEVRSVLEP